LYWPLWGCIFKRAGFISSKEPGVGSRAYIPTCLPVALDEDGSSLQLCFMLCTHKVEDLCNWIYVVILILLQWLLYFVLWCYLLIQGMAQYTGVLSLEKGGALHSRVALSQRNSNAVIYHEGKTPGSVLCGLVYAHGCALLVCIRVYDAKKNPVDTLGTLRITGIHSL
jgi:hypothetical protein